MIKEIKAQLRKKLRAQLLEQPDSARNQAAAVICQYITDHTSLLSDVENIALYSAHGAEIDLSELHRLLPDKKLLYPLCHAQGIITYHHVPSPGELVSGKYGILEPDPQIHPEFDITDIGLFFCPGLAFGKDGSRLGHGGGYYDRALAKKSTHRPVIACAISLNLQVFDTLPCETHDVKMDQIITERGIYHYQT